MTLLAHHTVAELSDWIAALDYEVQQIALAYGAFATTWQARDPMAHADWLRDWNAFEARYQRARTRALVAMGLAKGLPLSDAAIPAEDEWQQILHAVSTSPGAVGKGDLQDLYGRLVNATGQPIDLSKIPQPKAADLDLDAYKVADATAHALEKAARSLPTQRAGVVAVALVGAGLAGALLVMKAVGR